MQCVVQEPAAYSIRNDDFTLRAWLKGPGTCAERSDSKVVCPDFCSGERPGMCLCSTTLETASVVRGFYCSESWSCFHYSRVTCRLMTVHSGKLLVRRCPDRARWRP